MSSVDIKNKNSNGRQERQAYVPAKIKVINVSVQRVVCTSTERLEEETFEW